MSAQMNMNRRALLRVAVGAAGLPYVVLPSTASATRKTQPSNWITLGCIGVGGRGKEVMRSLIGHDDCRVVAVCDVNSKRLIEAQHIVDEQYGGAGCAAYADYGEVLARDDIDAVLIATPDQWHVLQAIEAARTGKDIYLEKPLGLSVAEDKALHETVRRYGTVFQFGTQQRSDRNFRFACELALNGRIGRIEKIVAATPASRSVDCYGPSPVPEWLDYQMWVGPARWMPYTQGVVDNCGQWGHISNFSLGWITTWGIHHADIAQWANGADSTGPIEIEGSGVFPPNGLYDCATAWDVTLRYANGVTVQFVDNKKHKQGILLQGSDGWVFVKRGSIDAHPKALLNEQIGPEEKRLVESNDHCRNFLDCIRTRAACVSSIDSAVGSDTVCHLSDIAMRLGRKLRWDPARLEFVADEQANRMLSRPMRAPWHL